ncbi:MAG: hypothetical protein J2P36_18355 [Ktedonobacteraceae bacterium]|nr:hypothetical protein [Ktedonobacteraceae bacterium]
MPLRDPAFQARLEAFQRFKIKHPHLEAMDQLLSDAIAEHTSLHQKMEASSFLQLRSFSCALPRIDLLQAMFQMPGHSGLARLTMTECAGPS